MWHLLTDKLAMVDPEDALPGRNTPVLEQPCYHRIFGDRLDAELPGTDQIHLAMGCFWGAEKLYWQLEGVRLTQVGYAGGYTPNPTYEEVCSGRTGHAEAVQVIFDPEQISLGELLKVFFENHDPTQGPRQGNDIGTQYRSAIWGSTPEQVDLARAMLERLRPRFIDKGFGEITTEVGLLTSFYPAEIEHQQYLDRVPHGYCPVHATGVSCG